MFELSTQVDFAISVLVVIIFGILLFLYITLKEENRRLKEKLTKKSDEIEYAKKESNHYQEAFRKENKEHNELRIKFSLLKDRINKFSPEEKDIISTLDMISNTYVVSNKSKIIILRMLVDYMLNHTISDDILNRLDTNKSISSSIKVLRAYYTDKTLSETLDYSKTLVSSMMSLILYKPKASQKHQNDRTKHLKTK